MQFAEALRDNLRVEVKGAINKFEGTLQAVFLKRNGAMRVVIEDDNRSCMWNTPGSWN